MKAWIVEYGLRHAAKARRRHLFRMLASSGSISFLPVPQFQSLGAVSAEDSYLMPVDEDRQAREREGSYRKAVEEQLFLTPGEIARVVGLPGTLGVETVLAVYRQQPPKKAECSAAVTQPSKSFWDPENKSEETPLGPTPIRRLDVGLRSKNPLKQWATTKGVFNVEVSVLDGIRL